MRAIETTQTQKGRFLCPLHSCAACFAEADDDDIDWLRLQAVKGMTTDFVISNITNPSALTQLFYILMREICIMRKIVI